MKSLFKNIVLITVGFLLSAYVFIVNGYKTEYIQPGSDRWYSMVQKGQIPRPIEVSFSEVRSNGYILEVYGTIKNPRSEPANIVKISADLFNKNGDFYHKCEHWIPVVSASSTYNFKFHCANLDEVKYKENYTYKVYIDG